MNNGIIFGLGGRTSSFITLFRISPVCVPFTKIAVLGSSISFGSRASIARFDRAFLGFLYDIQSISTLS